MKDLDTVFRGLEGHEATIAVVGLDRSGKTSLVSHLSHRLERVIEGESVPDNISATNTDRDNSNNNNNTRENRGLFPLLRLIRTPFFGIIRRAYFGVRRVVHTIHAPSRCARTVLKCGLHGPRLTLLDAEGEEGTDATWKAAKEQVDAVLFVTRLDDLRISKRDRIMLVHLIRCFGESVLERTLFVLTHGCALPPFALSYEDYVRGRRDVLWKAIIDIVPPVPIEPLTPQTGSTPIVECAKSPGEDEEESTVEKVGEGLNAPQQYDMERREKHEQEGMKNEQSEDMKGRDDGEEDEIRPVYEPPAVPPGDTVVQALCQDSQIQESDILTSILQPSEPPAPINLFDSGSDDDSLPPMPEPREDDKTEFKDPPPPEIVVVEFSKACPRDADGDGIVPSGEKWMDQLLSKLARKLKDSREATQRGLQKDKEETSKIGKAIALSSGRKPWSAFCRQVGSLAKRIARNGVWVVAAEVASVILFMQIGMAVEALNKRLSREPVKEGKEYTLVEMSDEEYEELTRVDTPEEASEDDEDELDQALENGTGGSMRNSEEYFFGAKENTFRGKDADTQENDGADVESSGETEGIEGSTEVKGTQENEVAEREPGRRDRWESYTRESESRESESRESEPRESAPQKSEQRDSETRENDAHGTWGEGNEMKSNASDMQGDSERENKVQVESDLTENESRDSTPDSTKEGVPQRELLPEPDEFPSR